jgi:hypothetical protein
MRLGASQLRRPENTCADKRTGCSRAEGASELGADDNSV